MRGVLTQNFFNRDTKIVAQELLGKFLVRKIGHKEIVGIITETEAYDGPNDLASHASRGRTPRTEVMFKDPGNFYIYLCYGMYWMLNVVTREKGYPAAVLIRGVLLENGVSFDGPGKVTKFFKISRRFNEKSAKKLTGLWFEDRGVMPNLIIKKLQRVGIAYAGPVWSAKKYRFQLTAKIHSKQ